LTPLILQKIRAERSLEVEIPTSLSTSPSFSMQDLRFFHHFLTAAVPYLPLGNEQVWTHAIPRYAEQCAHLMHAIMALGASHLSKVSGTDFLQSALVHRGRAITGLQQALFDETCSSADLDSILATCYALAFQTVYLDDGLADFIGMTRGCVLMSNRIQQHNMPSVFSLLPESIVKQRTLQDVQPRPNDTLLIRKGVEALEDFEARLSTSTQIAFFNLLISTLRLLRTCTQAGCAEFHKVYTLLYGLNHETLTELLDAEHAVSQVLLAYLLAIQLIFLPFAAPKWPSTAHAARLHTIRGTSQWARQIFAQMQDSELSGYLEWPKAIIMAIQQFTSESIPVTVMENESQSSLAGLQTPLSGLA
jgi:Fungal specific transcription factor domain